jgi:hypothetical protein
VTRGIGAGAGVARGIGAGAGAGATLGTGTAVGAGVTRGNGAGAGATRGTGVAPTSGRVGRTLTPAPRSVGRGESRLEGGTAVSEPRALPIALAAGGTGNVRGTSASVRRGLSSTGGAVPAGARAKLPGGTRIVFGRTGIGL